VSRQAQTQALRVRVRHEVRCVLCAAKGGRCGAVRGKGVGGVVRQRRDAGQRRWQQACSAGCPTGSAYRRRVMAMGSRGWRQKEARRWRRHAGAGMWYMSVW